MKKLSFTISLLIIAGCFSDEGQLHNEEESESGGDSESSDDTGGGGRSEPDAGTFEEIPDVPSEAGDGDGDGDGDGETSSEDLLDMPCNPMLEDDPCTGEYTCSLYEWDNVGNYFEFICKEYIGDEEAGGFGDYGTWGECKSGFIPLNNIGLANFPEGMCLGAGNGGTCCTPLCSALDPSCPAGMECNLFVDPMNPDLYESLSYGSCTKP